MKMPQKLQTFFKRINLLGIIINRGLYHWKDLSKEELHILRCNLNTFARKELCLGLHNFSEFCVISCVLICLFFS